jgi:hypothetical protein
MGLPTPVYRYDKMAERWKEASPDAIAGAGPVWKDRLVVVSFNVLFDLYHGLKDLIHTHKRTPYLLNMLRELDADVIGLQVRALSPSSCRSVAHLRVGRLVKHAQEVTPPFLNYMLEEEWVKENYFISEQDLAVSKSKATKKYDSFALGHRPFVLLMMEQPRPTGTCKVLSIRQGSFSYQSCRSRPASTPFQATSDSSAASSTSTDGTYASLSSISPGNAARAWPNTSQ